MTYAHDAAAIDAAAGSSWNLDTYAESRGWTGVALVPRITVARDEHPYDMSNMVAALAIMGDGAEYRSGTGERNYAPGVAIASLGHWAIGWIEYLAYDAGDPMLRARADDIAAALERYPLLNEADACEREYADNHPDGSGIGRYCYAERGAECHPTDDLGRILPRRDDRGRFARW